MVTNDSGIHGFADVNGIRMYYEIHGRGEPIVLLHGGLGSTEMFGNITKVLSEKRKVIAVDLQAHGRTADIDRALVFELMADDMADFLRYLQLEKADFMGYSLGGGVSLRTAIQYPGIVHKLVLVSTPFSHDGWYPEVRASMEQMGPEAAEQMKPSPIYHLYTQIAPKPQEWQVLVTKVGKLIRQDYDWSKEVETLKMPTMLVFGDADSISPAYAARFFELLDGGKRDAGLDGSGMSKSRLAILPGTMHYNILSSPLLVTIVSNFLDERQPDKTNF